MVQPLQRGRGPKMDAFKQGAAKLGNLAKDKAREKGREAINYAWETRGQWDSDFQTDFSDPHLKTGNPYYKEKKADADEAPEGPWNAKSLPDGAQPHLAKYDNPYMKGKGIGAALASAGKSGAKALVKYGGDPATYSSSRMPSGADFDNFDPFRGGGKTSRYHVAGSGAPMTIGDFRRPPPRYRIRPQPRSNIRSGVEGDGALQSGEGPIGDFFREKIGNLITNKLMDNKWSFKKPMTAQDRRYNSWQ